MKSKIKVLILCIVCIFCLCIVVNYNFSKNISENINNNTNPNNYKKNNNGISMMLEKTEGTGDYEVSTLSSWPTENYTFNTTLSKCVNGGELSWDDKNKIVLMSGNVSDKCYVYFDKKIKGLERKNLFDFVKSNCNCIFAYETDDVYLQNCENKRKLNVNNVTGILAWR